MASLLSTNEPGVFLRRSSRRRHNGKFDEAFVVKYVDPKGKQVKATLGWRSEGWTLSKAARERAARMQAVATPPAHKAYTLGDAWRDYRTHHLAGKACAKGDASRFTTHLAAYAPRQVTNITPFFLVTLETELKDKGLAPQTQRHVLAQVRRILNKTREWDKHSAPDPFAKFKMPSQDNHRLRYLTRDEAAALLAVIKLRSLPLYTMTFLALHTGLRLGELLRLTWADVQLDELPRLHVLDAKAGTRVTPMPAAAASLLSDWRREHPASPLFFGHGQASRHLTSAFTRAVDSVGLNTATTDRRHKVVFHTLRHTYASWLVMDGTPLATVAQLLGQTTLTVTQRYAHLCPDHTRLQMEQTFAHIHLSSDASSS